MSRPVLHVTNAASRALHGPGRLFHIMAWVPPWLKHEGCVHELVPPPELVLAFREKRIDPEEYQQVYDQQLEHRILTPGSLAAWDGDKRHWVLGGDTLVCICSKTSASMGECHRSMAAGWLSRAGWRVILDGGEI